MLPSIVLALLHTRFKMKSGGFRGYFSRLIEEPYLKFLNISSPFPAPVMDLLRALKLWVLYFLLWLFAFAVLLVLINEYLIEISFALRRVFGFYGTIIVASFHTAFKMKFGGFRRLFGPDRGIIGHYSRLRKEQAKRENRVLDYVNDEPDLNKVSSKFMMSSKDAVLILKKGINQGRISGHFRKNNSHFLSDTYVKKRIREYLL